MSTFPIYYDHKVLIVGNMTKDPGTNYQVTVKKIKNYTTEGQSVYVMNPSHKLRKELDKQNVAYTGLERLQAKYAHSCAWYMPMLHELQERPWNNERISQFFGY